MAGRKALVLTVADVQQVILHIKELPFKRKVQERFMEMLQGKRSMNDFSETDLELVKKCRYEMNAHTKQMRALAEIKAQSTHTRFEKEILEFSNKPDIDSYFLMLESLKIYLKKTDQKQAEIKIQNEKRRIERKQDDSKSNARKQRDRENYFLGSSLRKLFEETGAFPESSDDFDRLFNLVCLAKHRNYLHGTQSSLNRDIAMLNFSEEGRELRKIFNEMFKDPRNPFIND